MRNENTKQTKGVEMKTLIQQGYKIIDSSNDCANYAKANEDGTVTVETLYRYGKSVVKTYTKDEFIAWRNDVDGTKEVSLADVKTWTVMTNEFGLKLKGVVK